MFAPSLSVFSAEQNTPETQDSEVCTPDAAHTCMLSECMFIVLFFFREVMVPSLHWLLLLWGLQGLCAQDYEDYEDVAVTTKKKSKILSPNSIPQNGKCKCFRLPGLFSIDGLSMKCVQVVGKKEPQVKKYNIIVNKDIAGGMQSTWTDRISQASQSSISHTAIQCSVTQMFYSLRILFPQAHSACDIFL